MKRAHLLWQIIYYILVAAKQRGHGFYIFYRVSQVIGQCHSAPLKMLVYRFCVSSEIHFCLLAAVASLSKYVGTLFSVFKL